jgi:hypothetical protein
VLAQFIVDDRFPAVLVDGDFDKRDLDTLHVAQQEELVTRGWRRLQKVLSEGLPVTQLPLPEVRASLEE